MLKTNRGLLRYILLNLVTLGLYSLFFYHDMASDVNIACNGDGKHTKGLLAYILLTAITCGIYSLVWHYAICERVAMNSMRRGIPCDFDGGKFLLWELVGCLLCGIGPFIAMHKMFKSMNALCAAYNANPSGSMGGYGGTPVVNVNINHI